MTVKIVISIPDTEHNGVRVGIIKVTPSIGNIAESWVEGYHENVNPGETKPFHVYQGQKLTVEETISNQNDCPITYDDSTDAGLEDEVDGGMTDDPYDLRAEAFCRIHNENENLRKEVERLKKRLVQSEGYIYDRCLWEDYILGLEEESI